MMPTLDYRLWAVITLLFCTGIAWSCVCRLNTGDTDVMIRVRTKYTLLLGGALAFGGQPVLFGEWPGVAGAVFSGAVFTYMLAGMHRWRGEPPTEALIHKA